MRDSWAKGLGVFLGFGTLRLVCVCVCVSVVMPDIDAAHSSLLSVDRARKPGSPTQQVPWHIRIRNAASCTPLAWCGALCEDELCMRRGKWIYLSLTCGQNGKFEANPPCAGWMTVSRMCQRVHWAPHLQVSNSALTRLCLAASCIAGRGGRSIA